MTFGVLFGACLLTDLSLVRYRSFNNAFADSALGATIGAPLGVCVNCAAPIAQGLHNAGTKLETTLSALIASPTLNVIVVSMSFALLPTYMASIKLVAMLGFVLVGIPLLVRFTLAKERAASGVAVPVAPEADSSSSLFARFGEQFKIKPDDHISANTWPAALSWLLKSFFSNLWFLIRVTVPLMLAAGVLGAIVIAFVPIASLIDSLETFQGPALIVSAMVAMTAFALFLPVPIAFDVILSSVLVTAGVPAKYVLPILLGLGSFSVYSFLIIGRAISFKTSIVIVTALAGLALVSGVVGSKIEKKLLISSLEAEVNILRTAEAPARRIGNQVIPKEGSASAPAGPVIGPSLSVAAGSSIGHAGSGRVTASLTQLETHDAPRSDRTLFSQLQGVDIGLNHGDLRSDLDAFEPYVYYWAIAAGDINSDDWDDLVIANNAMQGGVSLYSNQGGTFVKQPLHLGVVDQSFVNATALVDLNNDGSLDLFAATFLDGVYVFWNRDGQFDADDFIKLPNGDAPMMGAPGFADLDNDGRLDIVAANWSVGTMTSLRNPHLLSSTDRILWNEGDTFSEMTLNGIPGESLTSIITDINGDGKPDIVIGDDIAKSDKIYLNGGG